MQVQLRTTGTNISSLLDIFSNVGQTLYEDQIHLKKDGRGESLGYRLMAERIAKVLGERWKLKARR